MLNEEKVQWPTFFAAIFYLAVMQNRCFSPNSGFGFLFTALAHLLNMNKCIHISGQKWKNEDLQYF